MGELPGPPFFKIIPILSAFFALPPAPGPRCGNRFSAGVQLLHCLSGKSLPVCGARVVRGPWISEDFYLVGNASVEPFLMRINPRRLVSKSVGSSSSLPLLVSLIRLNFGDLPLPVCLSPRHSRERPEALRGPLGRGISLEDNPQVHEGIREARPEGTGLPLNRAVTGAPGRGCE